MAEMNDIKIPVNLDPSLQAGYYLSHPKPGDEVVISGISGAYASSANIYEFQENLFNKVNLISPNSSRWTCDHPEVPKFIGTLPNVKDFDASFFGFHYQQAEVMDPVGRLIFEKICEAIMDAGINLNEIRGTKTAIIMSVSVFEGHIKWFYITPHPQALIYASHSVFAQLISYIFGTTGPSYIIDTACSSSQTAMDHAFRAIRMEKCDNAIVIGCNTLFHPVISMQFNRLGVLNKDGKSKPFDASADGYTRSEAACAVVLQKAKNARRVYAEIVHSKSNCDGYKEEGITYPSRRLQQVLLSEFYKECDINPADIPYVEAHGTGTRVGDPEEMKAVSNVYLEGRTQPLLIGSVKSNVGHTEPAAGVCSITKAIIAMETGYIPPNMHFNSFREEIKKLVSGKMVVVTEKTKLPGDLIAINSFGFGGSNCHCLLKRNMKEKINQGIPKDDLPRLVCISGRTKEAVETIINDVGSRCLDAEYIRLLQETFKYNIDGHYVRGYVIKTKKHVVTMKVDEYENEEQPIWFIFSGLGSQWAGMGASLMKISIFAATIEKCHKILLNKGIDLKKVITNNDRKIFEDNIHITVGITAIQLALVDLLNEIKINPKFIIGYSIGEIACAYADNCLSLEQAILCSYLIGEASREMKTEADLLKSLMKIIPKPVKRSKKWLTTMDNKKLSETCSAEYLVHSLSCAFVMKEKILRNTTIVEIAPHGHLQGLLKEAFGEDVNTLSLVKKDFHDTLQVMMTTIGELYLKGCNPRVEFLYPDIQFPVSRSTPMISPLIKWKYQYDWYLPIDIIKSNSSGDCTHNASIMLADTNKYLIGHMIDGRVLYPATGYLNLAWETFDTINVHVSKTCVVFKNIQLLRATTIPGSVIVHMQIHLMKGGNFEIVENDQAIAKGSITTGGDEMGNKEMTELPAIIPPKHREYKMLSEKDIYKELRLRGYYYSGLFRGIRSCDISGTVGQLAWNNNYVAFMDTMLQMALISVDTRSLFIPIGIDKVVINYKKHQEVIDNLKEGDTIPVYYYKHLNIIKSGGIEIQGIKVNAISRRKPLSEPVLETYKYIPNTLDKISIEDSIRIILQIIIENLQKISVRTVEYIDKEINLEEKPLLSPLIQKVLGDLPLIRADLNIFSNKTYEDLNGIEVVDKKLGTEDTCFLVGLLNGCGDKELVEKAEKALVEGGFILSREGLDFDSSKFDLAGYEVLLEHNVGVEKIVLIRKSCERLFKTSVDVTEGMKLDWLPVLQSSVKNDVNTVVYAEGDELSGVLGLVNCMRREPGNELVTCVYIMDKDAPKFNLNDEFYKKQLRKGLAINVFKDGTWGTYRHLLLETQKQVQVEHSYVNILTRGDLSSLRWFEGHLSTDIENLNTSLVHVYYTALNFRDIMTSTGKLAPVYIASSRIDQECVLGLEFAGRLSNGKRVIGALKSGATSTLVKTNPFFTWEIPDEWSFEDAVTIPIVYCTLCYGLLRLVKIQKGESILIHAGSGGIGQAAINMALFYGMKVYTTVGTKEKREFIKSTWPEIKDNQIGNSRDISFENMIMRETKGRGVDYVLNSLSEDKLLASVRCLAKNGKFLEIGKFDLTLDNPVSLEFIKKGASYHGIMLDLHFNAGTTHEMSKVSKIMQTGIKNGMIKPLSRKVFEKEEIEEAFRYMGAGKHIGKVLIKIRDEEKDTVVVPEKRLFGAIPRYVANSSGIYIITGGLGGFGLELADWLILRGARNIVLNSRKGITTGYQSYRIKIWRNYGANIHISTADITTFEGCKYLIEEAQEIGKVLGVFNLAVVLKDSILENQTKETYQISFGAKALATRYLDEITRKMCPDLKSFVVFSSVSCGRGNAGQTNYGMANSIMERICEQRKLAGYPAVAIQWGAVGEVGLVADMQDNAIELEIGGTLQQKISSCLSLLDHFLKQPDPIVASMVVAEKKTSGGAGGNAIDTVANILGIRDLKTVSYHSNLAELGMDSIMAVEIKQTLEREFEIFLTAQDIRTLTLAKLLDMGNTNKLQEEESSMPEDATILEGGFKVVLRILGHEDAHNKPIVILPSLASPECNYKCVMIPGIEGMPVILEPLTRNLECQVICSQPSFRILEREITKISSIVFEDTLSYFESSDNFVIIGYSYGSTIALEIASILEQKGKIGNIILIDGSPEMLRETVKSQVKYEDEMEFQNYCLMSIISLFIKTENHLAIKSMFENCSSWESKLETFAKTKPEDVKVAPEDIMLGCDVIYRRLKGILSYEPKYNKIKSNIKLIKPQTETLKITEDYGLSSLAENPVEVVCVPGNHITMLESKECADEINNVFKKK